ncbi:AF4/FMR2 family member 4-like [Amia ocellicauda]|uniref:AF4/FMR2 family member 4-like n=1 Tax=Amia ocellicauda TaxID=2972642 RepID=UPI003463FFE8
MSREDWNALLLKKMERRNQQIQRAAETFPAPYKVCRKGDKLASRIQSLLGDYDGVKDPIGDKTLEKPIVIPTPTVTTTPVEKSTQSCLGEQQCQRSKSPHDLKAKWDSPSHVQSFAPNEQHSVQAVPPSLLPKLGSLMQKPTAYVCPVDVQKSLKPKTLSKKHCTKAHSSSVGDMKSSSKVSLSKLKIPSQPLEVSMSGDANCVHEILKEMAQSWPPLLTPIRSPCKTAFLKFPFPAKDTPHSHVAEKYGSKASSASHLPKILTLQRQTSPLYQ